MRLIDADALKETLLKFNYTTANNQIFRYIDDQPTIEAVPVVHGEWIEIGVTCGITILKCSNCGKERPRLHEDFCRDCGADMRKGGTE